MATPKKPRAVPAKVGTLFLEGALEDMSVAHSSKKQDSFIEHHHDIDAVLFPVVAWLGRNARAVKGVRWIVTKQQLDLFGLTAADKPLLRKFISEEASKMFLLNENGTHVGYLKTNDLVAIIDEGCRILLCQTQATTIGDLRKRYSEEMSRFAKDLSYSKVARYLLNGRSDRFWYRHTHEQLVRILPMVNVTTLFNLMAGTSMNASLRTNIQLFFKALAQYTGGKKRRVHNSAVNRTIVTKFKGFLPAATYQLHHFDTKKELRGRKIFNFAQSMLGDVNAVVVDIWIMRTFGSDRRYRFRNQAEKSRSPEKKLYDAIEHYVRAMAAVSKDLEAREFCAMLWGGIRTEETGKKNGTRYTPYMAKYLHFNDLFLGGDEIYFGEDGIHFGHQASIDYQEKMRSNHHQ